MENKAINKLQELLFSPNKHMGYIKENDSDQIVDDKEYITHMSLEQDQPPILPPKNKRKFLMEPPSEDLEDLEIAILKIKEQRKLREQISSKNYDDKLPEEDDNQNPNMGGQEDPNLYQDPSMGMSNQDPSMMGMGYGMQPPEKTATQIGRIYELKKIYHRLLSIEEFLSFTKDERLLKLREFISKGIELFEVIISNITSFMKEDKSLVDGIIILYYKFILRIYLVLKTYYKKDMDMDKNNKKKNSKEQI